MDVEAAGAAPSGAGLAPVSVAPASQGQGIGDALIRAGIDALREQGIAISFVLGHETYYPRFGYSPELAARFASPFAGPHLMAMRPEERRLGKEGVRTCRYRGTPVQ